MSGEGLGAGSVRHSGGGVVVGCGGGVILDYSLCSLLSGVLMTAMQLAQWPKPCAVLRASLWKSKAHEVVNRDVVLQDEQSKA